METILNFIIGILSYILDNIWAISQTFLSGFAIQLAYKIGKRQIDLNVWYITLTETEKHIKETEDLIQRSKDNGIDYEDLVDLLRENNEAYLTFLKNHPFK